MKYQIVIELEAKNAKEALLGIKEKTYDRITVTPLQ